MTQKLPFMLLCTILLVLFFAVRPSEEFIPSTFYKYLLNVSTLDFSSFATHKDMTKSAVLSVAADVLRDNPNPESDGSGQRISALQNLDESRLLTAYYGEKRRNRIREFENAIAIMINSNAEVDSKEEKDAAAHFDSERFQTGQNRLVEKRHMTVSYIMSRNFDTARRETGRLLHTLQDFYSHSNWIENGNLSPYRVLGKPNERPENIAQPLTQTCTDCNEVGTVGRLFNVISKFLKSGSVYECSNVEGSLQARGILTSGYHGGQKDTNNQVIDKPSGKCSHGGVLDRLSDSHARDGINKDSPNSKWSPHYYLFNDAAAVATQATIDFLQEIRNEINDDQLFASFLGITLNRDNGDDVMNNSTGTRLSVAVSSVTYVIDTTGSMAEELPEIQATIPTIRRDLIDAFGTDMQVRYILVPFNDPDHGITYVTQNIDNFLGAIAELRADGGGYAPEPSIGALIRAVRNSDPGTSVFLFTDAPASDEHLFNEAVALIIEKQVNVIFALINTMSFRRKRALSYTQQITSKEQTRMKRQSGASDVYEQIAMLSGGQVLNIDTNDISEIGSLVSFSAIQGRTIIFRKSGVTNATEEHFFPVDIFCAEVIISISGDSIVTSVYAPGGVDATTLPQYTSTLSSMTLYIASINTTDSSLRGKWRLVLQSRGAYSIQVMATSDLTFSLTLFQRDSTNDYGVSEVNGKSLEGQLIIALVELHGVSQSDATVTNINLVDGQGTILLPINNVTQLDPETSYFVEFIQPAESYQLQLIGMDASGFNFSRISDISIESTSISLSLGEDDSGYIVLRPGENATVTLSLLNNGSASAFTLTVNTVVQINDTAENATDVLDYLVNPENTTVLTQQSNTTVDIGVYLFDNATDGVVVTFTVIATSDTDESVNDFITFDVVTTTLPPPKFTENDYSDASTPSTPLMTTVEVILASLAVWYGLY